VSTPVVLGGVSYRHGTWHQIADLSSDGSVGPDQIRALTQAGLSRFSVLDEPVRTHYPECVGESLDKAELSGADVDAVLFISSTFSSYDDHGDLVELCRQLGLTKALPIGLFLAQCSNFSYALMVAKSLIDAQGMRSVLLLGADALDESRSSRVLPANASVFSDTVLSCVVSADLAHGYRIEAVNHIVEPELSALDPAVDTLKFMDLFILRMQELCARAYSRTGLGPEEFSHLVLANLAIPVLRNYAAVSRIPFSRVATKYVGVFGHCFAYDQLITLAELADHGEIGTGDLAHVLGVGDNYLFSSTVARRV
jgi:3-oxoacyl-[acyl-carrier-protein] synthase III